jgi:putative PIN family toxin of toxin-antitoxin system
MINASFPQIVIDTNVVVAGLQSTTGAYQILQLIGKGKFDIALSVPTVLEYREILHAHRSRLDMSIVEIEDLLDYYCQVAHQYRVHYLWRPFLPDRDDDLVLELAVISRSAFIVTHNVSDFRGADHFGIKPLKPIQYLRYAELLP